MNKPIRHGEVILKPVSKIPKGETTTVDSYRVADSDAGHHHILQSKDIVVTTKDNNTFVEAKEEGTIIHQKETDRHKDLPIAPGKYQVLKKTEYDPFEKVLRDVKD